MPLETIAIVIGVSHYLQNDISSLPAAEVDAVNFARALKNLGIPEKNISLYLNDEIDLYEIDNLFDLLIQRKDSYKFIFYFCGHGKRISNKIPKSYLTFYNSCFGINECLNGLELDRLVEKISKMNSIENYIFIDACDLRINNFINPNLESEINHQNYSKNRSLFCLLSSGVEKSFENKEECYGYFTKALLKGFSHIINSDKSPTELLNFIHKEMNENGVPLPEMANFGNQLISFIPNDSNILCYQGKIIRTKIIYEIQDILNQKQKNNIFLYGDEGCGKTVICNFLVSKDLKTISFTIPSDKNSSFNPLKFIENEIHEKFKCSFKEFNQTHRNYLVIIDQLDRLEKTEIQLLLGNCLQHSNIKFVFVSRFPIEDSESSNLFYNLFVPNFNFEEGTFFIKNAERNLTNNAVEIVYIISKGNPRSIKKIINKNLFDEFKLEEFEKVIMALYGTGAYFDRSLFKEVFKLQEGLLEFFEKIDLVISFKNSFVPHLFLMEFAEYKKFDINKKSILKYWFEQVRSTPKDPLVAKSLILATKCFGYENEHEQMLNQAFKCLEINEENRSYFLDGAEMYLSLPYKTPSTLYLAKVLKALGEDKISKELLNRNSNKTKKAFVLIGSVLFMFIFIYLYVGDHSVFNSRAVYIKQIHPDFVGREDYLSILKQNLITRKIGNEISTMILWGEAGIGKSEIAVAFANLNLKHFDLVHWMDVATEESYVFSYQHLAAQLKIPLEQQEPIHKLVRKVHDYLENNDIGKWLLIYDNAEKEYELPQRGNGSIVVTSRDYNIWRSYPSIEIVSFNDLEALSLLKKITSKDSSYHQRLLIRKLENYPLSLNMASHYLADTPWMTEESYLNLLSEDKIGFLSTMPIDARYRRGLLNSWMISADLLHEKNFDALEWLYFCSFLHPDIIPASWLEEWYLQNPKSDVSSLRIKANVVLRQLVNLSLLRYDKSKKSLSVHRLKQEIFKNDKYFDPKMQEKVLLFLINSLEEFERIDEMERNTHVWPRLRNWELHAAWFLDKYSNSFLKEEIALLNNLLGSWKSIRGEYSLSEFYFNESLKIRSEIFGKEDLRTIITMNNKAWILWKLNKFKEAKALYEEAIISLTNNHSDRHPYLAFLLNNYTLVLKDLGEYELMREFNEKVLDMRMTIYGDNHVYIADSMHNLATSLWKLNRYDEALNYFQKALKIYRLCYDKNHPYIAITMHSLGRTFFSKGDYAQAENHLRAALSQYLVLYGEKHPYSFMCSQNIAQVLEKQEREKESLEMLMMIFIEHKKVYNEGHPYIPLLLEDLLRLSEKYNDVILSEIKTKYLMNP